MATSMVRLFSQFCGCRQSVLYTQVRYRRWNSKTQKMRPKPLLKRIFDEITKPIIIPPELPPASICASEKLGVSIEGEVNEYEEFLKKKCKAAFTRHYHKGFIICMALPFEQRQWFSAKVLLWKEGWGLSRRWSGSMVRELLADTQLSNVVPWINGRVVYITPDPGELNLKGLVKALKKVPFLFMIGGCIDKRLLTKEGIIQASKMPPIEEMRGELCSILNYGISKTHSLLSCEQQKLSMNLEQYVKHCQEGSSEQKEESENS